MPSKVYDQSELEAAFLYYWRLLAPADFPEPKPQFPYFNYKVDYAFPDEKVAVELDGGRGGGYGRAVRCHACGATVRARLSNGGFGKPLRIPYPSHSGKQQERDLVKQNLLAVGGWSVLRFSSFMLEEDPEGCIKQVIRLVGRLNDENDVP